ncbi:MAG TPA: deoxyribodipyrimidine photo-lyase [Longimicrobiales bacterium]|nr:deoxyribodipyrimidine photo-lyase [Longimicrobiales bacterium]
MSLVPPARVRALNPAPVRAGGGYVLYWMTSSRRLEWNFALDRALEHARELRLPLVILEALRVAYPWASQRFHAFVLDGMREHRAQAEAAAVAYHPYIEPAEGAGKGLVATLAERAAVVVTDDFPAFFLRRMQAAVAPRLGVALEAVDGNGLLPLAATPGPFTAAYHFRRFLQKTLGEHLVQLPGAEPLTEAGIRESVFPADVAARWPAASEALLALEPSALAALPVDHRVGRTALRGGGAEARRLLGRFLDQGLPRYGEERNHPDAHAASGLSPWLHWGHISVHEIFHAVAVRESWSPARLGAGASGQRHGWWGMSPSAESYLDELVTWRELGYGYCHHVPDHDRYDSLPVWALETLARHATDPREAVYTLQEFDRGLTHDPIWNAAQRELRESGVMQNYLRMLWGKKILEWSRHPTAALEIMIELNNRYALDGCDPNSYTGIFWVLGRFDRGWPERPVYGKVRSMSSASTRRKLRMDAYLKRWGAQGDLGLPPTTP